MNTQNLLPLLRAIFTEEGYFGESARGTDRPRRNRNPGDLRGSGWQGQTGSDVGEFCRFQPDSGPTGPDADALRAEMEQLGVDPMDYWGYRAARLDIQNHAARWPGQSLVEFVAGNGKTSPPYPPANCWTGYAPASDSNDAAGYAQALARALGCALTTTFSEL